MKYRTFGNTGIEVSEIGFGAWAIGGSWGSQSDDDSVAALKKALESGVNFIDTAAGYGDGRSERIIGRVLDEMGLKGKVTVATKTPATGKGPWPPSPYCAHEERYGADYLAKNLEERLACLGTDCIDILQLHTWTRAWNREPSPFETLRRFKEQGKIRFIGVSTPEHDQNSVSDLMKEGWGESVQVIYNILEQEPAAELLPVAQETGTGVIARVAFDEGSLTGKFTKDTRFEEGDFRRNYFSGNRLEKTIARVDQIKEDVEGSGYDLPQAALKFALAHPAVSLVIPGMRNERQAELNTSISDLPDMSDEFQRKLRRHNWRRAFWYGG